MRVDQKQFQELKLSHSVCEPKAIPRVKTSHRTMLPERNLSFSCLSIRHGGDVRSCPAYGTHGCGEAHFSMRWRAAMIPAAPETKKEYAIYLKKNVEKRRESGKPQKKRRESGKPQHTPKHVAQLYLPSKHSLFAQQHYHQ